MGSRSLRRVLAHDVLEYHHFLLRRLMPRSFEASVYFESANRVLKIWLNVIHSKQLPELLLAVI